MDFSIASILNAIALGFLAVFVCICLFLKRKQNYWAYKRVPHVRPDSLIFGNLKDVIVNKKNMFEKQLELYRKFEGEPFCGFYEFHYPVLMVRDPQLIQMVLAENFNSFERSKLQVNEKADEILSYNPFIYHGQRWKDSRALLAAGLTPNKLRSLEEISKVIAQEMFAYLDNNPNDIEVNEGLISRFNSEMVANFGWGIKSDGFSSESTVKKAFDLVNFSSSSSFELAWFHPFFSNLLGFRLFPKELCNFLRSITEQSARNSKSNHYNLLQHLTNTRDKLKSTGKDMSMRDLAGHMGTFFIDAYETTSRVLSYVIYCLMLYPEFQKKVKDEIMKFDEEITIEGVSKLQYLDMFISEVQRYYPILIYLGRICTKRCQLGSLDVEKGTFVIVPIVGINYDPNIYPEPDVFDPEHFSEESKSKRHKFTFFPFGQGPRMCLGNRYALANMKLLLVNLLKHYDVVPPKDHAVHKLENIPECKVVYCNKNPLYVQFKKTA